MLKNYMCVYVCWYIWNISKNLQCTRPQQKFHTDLASDYKAIKLETNIVCLKTNKEEIKMESWRHLELVKKRALQEAFIAKTDNKHHACWKHLTCVTWEQEKVHILPQLYNIVLEVSTNSTTQEKEVKKR